MTSDRSHSNSGVLSRAQGCLLGQLIGDSLGSLVEFQTPERIRSRYPEGVRDMADGGTSTQLRASPRMIQRWHCCWPDRSYQMGRSIKKCRKGLRVLVDSNPFDVGGTISAA